MSRMNMAVLVFLFGDQVVDQEYLLFFSVNSVYD